MCGSTERYLPTPDLSEGSTRILILLIKSFFLIIPKLKRIINCKIKKPTSNEMGFDLQDK